MSYKDKREMLKNFDLISDSEKEALAKLNKCTVDEMRRKLEVNCYYIDILSINAVKALRRDINHMSDEEIIVVERVNNIPLAEIVKILDEMILEDKNLREYNKAWENRKKELEGEILEEDISRAENGLPLQDMFSKHRRFCEEQVLLAKKMGLHIKFYDPFLMEFFES